MHCLPSKLGLDIYMADEMYSLIFHPHTHTSLKTHTLMWLVGLKAGAESNFQGQQDYQCVFWKMVANQLSG